MSDPHGLYDKARKCAMALTDQFTTLAADPPESDAAAAALHILAIWNQEVKEFRIKYHRIIRPTRRTRAARLPPIPPEPFGDEEPPIRPGPPPPK